MSRFRIHVMSFAVFATMVASVAFATPNVPSMSSANFRMDWSAMGEISGGASTSAGYKLLGTMGQMAAYTSSASAGYKLCTGFQCAPPLFRVDLPLAIK